MRHQHQGKKMSKKTLRGACRAGLIASAAALLVPTGVEPLSAQQDPTTIGAGQRPYILIMLDSSASMEYSLEGEERYPCTERQSGVGCDASVTTNPPPGAVSKEWAANGSITTTGNPDDFPSGAAFDYIGPCRVWRPSCNQYERPVWYAPGYQDIMQSGSVKSHYQSRTNDMRGRYNEMTFAEISRPLLRVQDTNQPRHFQIKEILTGDMVLRPRNLANDIILNQDLSLNPAQFGPGCFFVPRMVGASAAADGGSNRVCHEETPSGALDPRPGSDFHKYFDYTDVRPHFQEVFDFQLRTGLMDNLSNAAIFGVALLDGYRGDLGPGGNISAQLNDPMDSSTGSNGTPEASDRYNLGVYKFIGPKSLDISSSNLTGISALAQFSVVDTGFQQRWNGSNFNGNNRYEVDPDNKKSNFYGIDLPTGLKNIMPKLYSGQIPMGGATPLAAAIHDIHDYFKNGTREFRSNGTPQPGMGPSKSPHLFNPIDDDPYKQCRAKHIVMMTDGFPLPESRTGPISVNDVGSAELGPAFGYFDPTNTYPYDSTESEVLDFVTEANSGVMKSQFLTRVHVVGLNREGGTEQSDINRKMGEVARQGNTCALYYLAKSPAGQKYIPGTGHPDAAQFAGLGGTCGAGGNCIVPQIPTGTFTYPSLALDLMDATSPPIDCVSPALVLSQNDRFQADMAGVRPFRDDLTEALQIIFNEVLNLSGGVASRTRASFTSQVNMAGGPGQLRLYSGVEVSANSIYWQGLINRETSLCSTVPSCTNQDDPLSADTPDNRRACVWPLHEDVSYQVRENGTGEYIDNRRIFTIEPEFDDGAFPNHGLPDTGKPESAYLVSGARLIKASGGPIDDVFDEVEFHAKGSGSANPALAEGTRIPMRVDALVRLKGGDPLNLSALSTSLLGSILGVDTPERLKLTVDTIRGRIADKQGRILNGILNSNPVTVGPPSLDLPIASYRDYRERYRNRPTMLYVSTLDGLLHAIHTGEQDEADFPIRRRDVIDGKGGENSGPVMDGVESQREAWAYSPRMLRNLYAQNLGRQPNLLDGTPIVADVRLCDKNPEFNPNEHACGATDVQSDPASQWRTVLVQGLGQAGSGYFALDVTRTGGATGPSASVVDPDPIPLWEFDADWERRQIQKLKTVPNGRQYYGGNDTINLGGCSSGTDYESYMGNDLDELPFLGLSVGDPAIGTVSIKMNTNDDSRIQRPVAMFGAGQIAPDLLNIYTCKTEQRIGRALYIVDLQTGSLLRRFVDYTPLNDTSTRQRFEVELTGTPVMYNNRPGTVANRAFIGDAVGRLFRIDMSAPDPTDWAMQLMYDPCTDSSLRAKVGSEIPTIDLSQCDTGDAGDSPFGAAAFPPAVAQSSDRNLVVISGLGDRTDTSTGNKAQVVTAVVEDLNGLNGSDEVIVTPIVRWHQVLEHGEKLTGQPTVFNAGVYFTSYKIDPADACVPGTSRIYGLDFNIQEDGGGTVTDIANGLFEPGFVSGLGMGTLASPGTGPNGNHYWVGPEEPTLIRGVAVSFQNVCALDPGDALGRGLNENADPQPQLIAQTGGAEPAGTAGQGRPSEFSKDSISRFVLNLKPPRTQTVPLSWAVISN